MGDPDWRHEQGSWNKEFGVSGNHEKVSYGGKLVHQLLATKEYLLLNNTEKCKGGPFTRY